jgi:uncharacterized protein (TIGR02266 family)
MSTKTVLIAHRLAAVRDRFAVAVADARHQFVSADTAVAAHHAALDPARPIDLALVDLGLIDDGIGLERMLRKTPTRPIPVAVFSGTVRSAADVPALAAMQVSYINEYAATPHILPALAPHLFPDSFNRRASTRVAIGVPVSYRAGQTIAGAVTLDVGKGGLAIRTMNPLARDTAVQVKFRLPGAPAEIEATGRVAWTDRNLGMGIQFDVISVADQHAIDTFVDDASSK